MKNKLSVFAIVSVAIIAFATCKKPVPDLALYIPKNASFVLTIDPKSIMDKIASSGISIDSLANLLDDKDDKYAVHWNDIKNSGIDLSQSIYIFATPANSMQAGKTISSGVIAKVQDASKLEAFFKKEKAGADVVSGDKYKYIKLNEGTVAGWNDKVCIISSVINNDNSQGEHASGQGAASQQQLNTLFTQSESASIAAADGFRDMLSKKGDMQYYTNASANLNTMAIPGMAKAGSLLEGSYSVGSVDFDKGKITATSETHNSKALADIMQKYPARTIDKSMITSYPNNINGFAILSFNPKMLVDVLHYLGVDMMADGFMTNLGFSTSDVLNAFSGDIAAIVSRPQNESMQMGMSGTEFLVNVRIGDRVAFDKVITGLVNKKLLSKNGDQYELGAFGGHNFIIENTGNALIIASSDALIKTYQAHNAKSTLPNDIDKTLNDKSVAFYVNINSLMSANNSADTLAGKTMGLAKSTFKDFIATADKSDGKIMTGNFELDLMNQDENSLASLVKFITVAHEEDMERRQSQTSIFMDSVPPMQEEPAKSGQ